MRFHQSGLQLRTASNGSARLAPSSVATHPGLASDAPEPPLRNRYRDIYTYIYTAPTCLNSVRVGADRGEKGRERERVDSRLSDLNFARALFNHLSRAVLFGIAFLVRIDFKTPTDSTRKLAPHLLSTPPREVREKFRVGGGGGREKNRAEDLSHREALPGLYERNRCALTRAQIFMERERFPNDDRNFCTDDGRRTLAIGFRRDRREASRLFKSDTLHRRSIASNENSSFRTKKTFSLFFIAQVATSSRRGEKFRDKDSFSYRKETVEFSITISYMYKYI